MRHLADKGIEFHDYGTYSEESCDYPDFGEAVGRAVASGECERGIVICGTGIGISLAANKVRGCARRPLRRLLLRRDVPPAQTTPTSSPWASAS